MVSAYVTDAVLYGLDTAKVAYIINNFDREISEAIVQRMDRGVTILKGEGAYSGDKKRVLMCAFKQKEIVSLKELIFDVDPNAFIIVCNAHEVTGNGFEDPIRKTRSETENSGAPGPERSRTWRTLRRLEKNLEDRGIRSKLFCHRTGGGGLPGPADRWDHGGDRRLYDRQTMGLYPRLSAHNRVVWHWEEAAWRMRPELRVYLTSANGAAGHQGAGQHR
ncbi:MAG: YitT family protein [Oscillospiraceae bacterium]